MAHDALTEARKELAAAFRLAVRFGLHEGIDNHFSLLVPGSNRTFLMNGYGYHWSEITASSLLVLDMEGRVLAGSGETEPTAVYIHSRIHRSNPRAACVLHTHMPYTTTLTTLEGGRLEPISQTVLRFHDDVAYDDSYNGLVLDTEEGDRVAAALGDKRVLLLANHGAIVIGRSVAEAFEDLYFLERASELQVMAMMTNRPLRRIAEATARSAFGGNYDLTTPALKHFAALRRLLDREESDYVQ
jgi:ribulose-5-phosphate 4-epimerase/fuculose-1-phosphate aldolase